MEMYQSSLANLVPCIVMLGLDSAGKTTIFSNLMIKKSVETIPTYVFNVYTVWPCKGVTIILRDVGEKEILRLLWQHYLANIQGLIFVVDKRKEESVRQGKIFFSILETPEAWGLPLIIIGDRPGLPHMLESQELAQELSLSAQSKLLARPRGICHN